MTYEQTKFCSGVQKVASVHLYKRRHRLRKMRRAFKISISPTPSLSPPAQLGSDALVKADRADVLFENSEREGFACQHLELQVHPRRYAPRSKVTVG